MTNVLTTSTHLDYNISHGICLRVIPCYRMLALITREWLNMQTNPVTFTH